jgi:hypothetical protein
VGDKTPLVDPDRLRPWLDDAGIGPGAALAVARITTGHSNEVFLVERGHRTLVLRRPPRTPLSPSAHDMAREYRLLTAFVDHDALGRMKGVTATARANHEARRSAAGVQLTGRPPRVSCRAPAPSVSSTPINTPRNRVPERALRPTLHCGRAGS